MFGILKCWRDFPNVFTIISQDEDYYLIVVLSRLIINRLKFVCQDVCTLYSVKLSIACSTPVGCSERGFLVQNAL